MFIKKKKKRFKVDRNEVFEWKLLIKNISMFSCLLCIIIYVMSCIKSNNWSNKVCLETANYYFKPPERECLYIVKHARWCCATRLVIIIVKKELLLSYVSVTSISRCQCTCKQKLSKFHRWRVFKYYAT